VASQDRPRPTTMDDVAQELERMIRPRPNRRAATRATGTSQGNQNGSGGTGSGMANPMTAEGDTIYGGPAGAPRRRAAGTEGQVYTMRSGVPTWDDATGGAGAYVTVPHLLYDVDFEDFLWEDGHPLVELIDLPVEVA
jgi:hypothetical protein